MATGKIAPNYIGKVVYTFYNLNSYSGGSYYKQIPDAFATAGVPSTATVIGLIITGWSGLGSVVNVG